MALNKLGNYTSSMTKMPLKMYHKPSCFNVHINDQERSPLSDVAKFFQLCLSIIHKIRRFELKKLLIHNITVLQQPIKKADEGLNSKSIQTNVSLGKETQIDLSFFSFFFCWGGGGGGAIQSLTLVVSKDSNMVLPVMRKTSSALFLSM